MSAAYAYDPIGNRSSYTAGTDDPLYYCANELNQYASTDAEPGCPSPVTESFSYDDDGNLTEVGGTGVSPVGYTWNAENRLTCVAPASSPVNGDKKVELTYDYMGRRVEKVVSTYEAGWTVSGKTRFVYHNWLLLLELDGLSDNAVLRKYAWGLDLSGSLEDAGGIGGLLGQRDPVNSKRFIYFHDANGNVGQMIDRSDGSLAAKYEYDAYGNNLLDPNDPNESGPYADDNPFRFSTKYWDDETGLGYWGYRYYAPTLGRWISRDLVEELGGNNLYQYASNAPPYFVDPIGLWPDDSGEPSRKNTNKWPNGVTNPCPDGWKAYPSGFDGFKPKEVRYTWTRWGTKYQFVGTMYPKWKPASGEDAEGVSSASLLCSCNETEGETRTFMFTKSVSTEVDASMDIGFKGVSLSLTGGVKTTKTTSVARTFSNTCKKCQEKRTYIYFLYYSGTIDKEQWIKGRKGWTRSSSKRQWIPSHWSTLGDVGATVYIGEEARIDCVRDCCGDNSQ